MIEDFDFHTNFLDPDFVIPPHDAVRRPENQRMIRREMHTSSWETEEWRLKRTQTTLDEDYWLHEMFTDETEALERAKQMRKEELNAFRRVHNSSPREVFFELSYLGTGLDLADAYDIPSISALARQQLKGWYEEVWLDPNSLTGSLTSAFGKTYCVPYGHYELEFPAIFSSFEYPRTGKDSITTAPSPWDKDELSAWRGAWDRNGDSWRGERSNWTTVSC